MDYDILVVGGGIHGVGVAQAAAARGHSTLLVEKTSLAAGTSSRSSKLIHGGLRYLESWEFGLVRECLRERETLVRIAPGLVSWVPFLIPVAKDSKRGPWMVRAGLSVYALLGGLREHARFRSVPEREWSELDGLDIADVRHVFQYWDAQTNDAALTAAVMESAREHGAELACPTELVVASRVDGGYEVELADDRGTRKVTTAVLVNAAGPWINTVLERVAPPLAPFPVDLVQGTHLVIDENIEQGVYYLEAPRDGRPVFVIPWQGRAMVGTTEHRFEGDPGDVRPLDEEIDYLLEAFHHHFPDREGTVLESWAGLRVLPRADGGMNERTRETTLLVDVPSTPRCLTIAGGKLTGYRATAERVMKRLAGSLPAPERRLDTRHMPLAVSTETASEDPSHRAGISPSHRS